MDFAVSRNRMLDVREITRTAPSCPSSVIMASVTPSDKYSDGPPGDKSANGNTASDATAGASRVGRQAYQPTSTAASSATPAIAAIPRDRGVPPSVMAG